MIAKAASGDEVKPQKPIQFLPTEPSEDYWWKLKLNSRHNKKLRLSKRRRTKFPRPSIVLWI
jgi:hypothetical protein